MELRGVLEIEDLQGHRSAANPRALLPQRLHGSRSGTAAPPLRSGYAQTLRVYRPAGDTPSGAAPRKRCKKIHAPDPTAAARQKRKRKDEKS